MSPYPDIILDTLSDYVREKIGINYLPKSYDEFGYKVKNVIKDLDLGSIDDLLDYVIQKPDDKQLIAKLALHLTVGETYFWRDYELFTVLEKKLIPELIEHKRKTQKVLRIWSAGSSSGEEAYSIAILLKRLIPDINDWNITILATDINSGSLEKAKKGVFSDWSFRSAPSWLKKDYFSIVSKNEYRIDDTIKKMVTFSYLNLVLDSYPSLANNTNGMDIIFCRNVLMYFDLDLIKLISDKLYNCLIDKGFFITNPSESYQFISQRFRYSKYREVSVYRKDLSRQEESKTIMEIKEPKPKHIVIPLRPKKNGRTTSIINRANKKTEVKSVKPKKQYDKKSLKIDELYSAGRYLEAESKLEHKFSEKISQNDALLMARVKANLGKFDEALRFCDISLGINKLSSKTYYLIAMIEIEKSNLELAYKALKKSFYLDSSLVITNYTLAMLASQLGKTKESNKCYNNTRDLLLKFNDNDIIPESDGLTAGRMLELINSAY